MRETVPFLSRRRWSGAAARRRPPTCSARRSCFRSTGSAGPRGRGGGGAARGRVRDDADGLGDGDDPSRPSRSGSSCSPRSCAPTPGRPSRSSAPRASRSRCSRATRRRRSRRSRRRRDHRRRRRRRPRAAGERRELRELAVRATVIGRISPEGKRRVVEALRDAGRYVAMVGDGVNDVPALKAARLAIAQGSGRADGPQRGRRRARARRLRGGAADGGRGPEDPAQHPARGEALRREVGVRGVPHPLDRPDGPIAVPAAAAAPDARRGADGRDPRRSSSRSRRARAAWRATGFLREVARFAVPGGHGGGARRRSPRTSSRLNVVEPPLVEARTVATTVLVLVGLYLAARARDRRRGGARRSRRRSASPWFSSTPSCSPRAGSAASSTLTCPMPGM